MCHAAPRLQACNDLTTADAKLAWRGAKHSLHGGVSTAHTVRAVHMSHLLAFCGHHIPAARRGHWDASKAEVETTVEPPNTPFPTQLNHTSL